MDLQHPERKMSKSADSPLGTIGMLDSDEEITRKVRKAVTDTDGEMRYDRAAKPGLANLLDLLAGGHRTHAREVATGYERYGDLKNDVAEALFELLGPVRERAAPPSERDPAYVDAVLARGAARAHEVAARPPTPGRPTPWVCWRPDAADADTADAASGADTLAHQL